MTANFTPVQTDIGYATMLDSAVNGQNWQIVAIAIGDGNGSGYIPDVTQTALRNEKMRVPVVAGTKFSDGFRAIAEFNYDPIIGTFPIREISYIIQAADQAPVSWAVFSRVGDPIDTMDEGKHFLNSYNMLITRGDTSKLIFLPPDDAFQVFNLDITTGFALAQIRNSATLISEIISTHYTPSGA